MVEYLPTMHDFKFNFQVPQKKGGGGIYLRERGKKWQEKIINKLKQTHEHANHIKGHKISQTRTPRPKHDTQEICRVLKVVFFPRTERLQALDLIVCLSH